ncbi:MAG TPA: hypothetical protein VH912_20585 [Streptosporangiaceae bacterium]
MTQGRPHTLTAGAGLEAAEGVAALAFGVFVGWESLFGEPYDTASAVGVTLLAFLAGAGMLVVARGLFRMRRWGRAPAVVTQLFGLFIAWNLIQSDQLVYGVPLAVCAVAAVVLLLSRPSTEALQ